MDMIYFKVAMRNDPERDEFIKLIKIHKGIHYECNLLNGKEYNYIDLGGWLGSQGIALQFMALGTLLGVFDLITPYALGNLPDNLIKQMAGNGFIIIKGVK
jgi:hypothetical protein